MQLFDVCTRKIYEKDGEQKVKWYKAGIVKETDNGKIYLKMFHQPDTEFFLFNRLPTSPLIAEEEADITN